MIGDEAAFREAEAGFRTWLREATEEDLRKQRVMSERARLAAKDEVQDIDVELVRRQRVKKP